MSVNVPNSLLQYWSSVARQQGVECRVDKGEFSIHYILTLTPIEDGLKHRPRANWTICSCEGRVDRLTVWVQRRVEPTEHKEVSGRFMVAFVLKGTLSADYCSHVYMCVRDGGCGGEGVVIGCT